MWVHKACLFFIGVVAVAGCLGRSAPKNDVETVGADDPIPQTTDNLNESITRFITARQLKASPIEVLPTTPPGLPQMGVPSGDQAAKWQSKAFGRGRLLQGNEKANVLFEAPRCMRGDGCGCDRGMTYFFATASDGHIVILEPKPNVHTRTFIRPGSCGYGCGQPSPPQPPAYYELPVSDMKLVEFMEVPFELWEVVVSCEDPTPRP